MDPAPSQIPEALAAVTTPSFLNTGLRADILSRDVSGRGCSSVSMTYVLISCLRKMGVIKSQFMKTSCMRDKDVMKDILLFYPFSSRLQRWPSPNQTHRSFLLLPMSADYESPIHRSPVVCFLIWNSVSKVYTNSIK